MRSTNCSPSFPFLLMIVCLTAFFSQALSAPQPAPVDQTQFEIEDGVDKRGGARAFRGFSSFIPSAKRLSGGSPYFLMDKRGGGRAFHSAQRNPWAGQGFGGFRLERRGGGRAFAGDWSDALGRYYDSPYLYKRSLDGYMLPYGYY
ncbi:unnamed protein product, partial [Mesorhabditis belari]|uniref:Uncharacterized protein n=1 Tax=Mesorhabditis belari TaxID=2138241 RepID=A0AAF3ELH8_9BILA